MTLRSVPRSPEEFFEGAPDGLDLYRAVEHGIAAVGPAAVHVSRSEIAFRRRRAFAFVWRPARYVRSDVPAVLSIALPRKSTSDRFKSVVYPSERVWLHHLELRDPAQLDDEVLGWLAEAYAVA